MAGAARSRTGRCLFAPRRRITGRARSFNDAGSCDFASRPSVIRGPSSARRCTVSGGTECRCRARPAARGGQRRHRRAAAARAATDEEEGRRRREVRQHEAHGPAAGHDAARGPRRRRCTRHAGPRPAVPAAGCRQRRDRRHGQRRLHPRQHVREPGLQAGHARLGIALRDHRGGAGGVRQARHRPGRRHLLAQGGQTPGRSRARRTRSRSRPRRGPTASSTRAPRTRSCRRWSPTRSRSSGAWNGASRRTARAGRTRG